MSVGVGEGACFASPGCAGVLNVACMRDMHSVRHRSGRSNGHPSPLLRWSGDPKKKEGTLYLVSTQLPVNQGLIHFTAEQLMVALYSGQALRYEDIESGVGQSRQAGPLRGPLLWCLCKSRSREVCKCTHKTACRVPNRRNIHLGLKFQQLNLLMG